MKNSTEYVCNIILLPRGNNKAGNITAVNNQLEIPFGTKSVYYMYDVPGGVSRGGQVHIKLERLIVAASGNFEMIIDDGNIKRTFHLARLYYGLYMQARLWRKIDNSSSGSICLALASKPHSESYYIRDY